MGIFDGIKKIKLYKKLRHASQEELLDAIKNNPNSYDVVIKVLHKHAVKLNKEWDEACNSFLRKERNKNYVRKKRDEFNPKVSECFSAIIEREPQYIEKARKFNRHLGVDFDLNINISLSVNALNSIPPFEKSDSPILNLATAKVYTEYLCDSLRKNKSLAEKAYNFIREGDEKYYTIPVAQTIMEVNPNMADRFLPILSSRKFDESLYRDCKITTSIVKAKPELTAEVLKETINKDGIAQENPQGYLDYIKNNPKEVAKEYHNLLSIMANYPEFNNTCVSLFKSLSEEGKKYVIDNLNSIRRTKNETYYRRYTDIPETFFELAKADNSYLQFANPENISLKLLQDISNDHPEKSDEISQFIVDKFCREDRLEGLYSNDFAVISGALKTVINNDNISYTEGMDYANKMSLTKYKVINEEPNWMYRDQYEAQDGGWEEGCWLAELRENRQHIEQTTKTFNDNLAGIYISLSKKQPNQKETEPAQRPQKGKYDKQLKEARKNLKKARESVSGVVMADAIAEKIKAGKEKNVTPDRAKEMKREYALAKKQAFHQ